MYRLIASALLAFTAAACAPHVVRSSNAPPAAVQFKMAGLPRVWVAGFATERKPEFDLNTEAVLLLRRELRLWSSAQIIEAEPLSIDAEQKLSDVSYWRRLGEEHGTPLIVTGTVKLHLAPARVVHRGVRTVYAYATGRVLDATVVLIDGRTGEVVSTSKLPSRMRYGLGRFGSGLSLFMQIMQAGMSDWFDAISNAQLPTPT